MKQHFIHDLAMCKYQNIPCNKVSRTTKTGREYGVNYFIVEMNVSLLYCTPVYLYWYNYLQSMKAFCCEYLECSGISLMSQA